MSFKVGDRVKIINEGRTGVIKDLTRSWPVMYIVLRDALFKGEKGGRYALVFEENLEHIDPVQHALNEGFNNYMKAAGYDSKEKNVTNAAYDEIKEIIFSGPKTIVFWKDGTNTVVSRADKDCWDPFAAFCVAYTKKHLGSTNQIHKVIDKKSNINIFIKYMASEFDRQLNDAVALAKKMWKEDK